MIRCSIVVRTLNEARYLGQLLEMIHRQDWSHGETEVIIVDSGSTDETLSIAEKFGCRILHLRREEFSFGRSLNVGCDAARGEFLVFVSGHCIPGATTWLTQLLMPFDDPEVAIVYGRQEGGPETKFSEHCLFRKYFPKTDCNGQAPFFCNNANLAMRTECWRQHRFDESLTGLEDMFLAKQLWQRGQRISYSPEASVLHLHHETWRQVRRRYEREAIALKEIMPEVHIHWYDAVRYFLVGVRSDWVDALRQKMFSRKAIEILQFRYCQFYGAWKGNHTHRYLSRQEKERYFYPR